MDRTAPPGAAHRRLPFPRRGCGVRLIEHPSTKEDVVLADLHAHYAMHLLPEDRPSTFDQMRRRAGSRRRDRVRAWIVGLAGRFANYESFESGPRVTLSSLKEGDVGVVLSVLYSPFDEIDFDQP